MRLEVDLAPSAIGDVGVALGRSEICMPEHLLDGTQIGSALEQVCREGVAQEVGVDAARLEARPIGKLSQDEESARARQRATADVQEELWPVPAVEVRAPEREVAAHRFRGRAPERYQALLVSLAEHADDSLFEGDATLLEPDRLGHTETGAVEELDERPVAQRSWARAGGRVDETLGLRRRKRAGERARPPR